MQLDKFEICENCVLPDYIAVIAFILFPPMRLYLLIVRRNEWKLSGIAWQEYLFLITTIVAWIVVFSFNSKLINGVFTANVAMFFTILTSSFLGISLPVCDYLARFLVASVSSLMSLELSIGTAIDWDKTLPHNSCATKINHIGLIEMVLFIVVFIVLPMVNRQPSLLADLVSKKTPVTIDWVYSTYAYLLLLGVASLFLFKNLPNFLLALSCGLGFGR